jgi:TonB family protein
MADKSPQEDLDWNTLSNPVPLDYIDPEFPSQVSDMEGNGAEPSEAPMPGARSEILPREESEALLEAHDAQPELRYSGALPPDPATTTVPASDAPAPPTEAYAPPAEAYAPPAEEYAPPEEAFTSLAEAFPPRAEVFAPPAEAFTSPAEPLTPPAEAFAPPADGFEPSPAPFPFQSAYPSPLQIDNPPTIMMEAKGLEKLADNFSRMRAKMDADAETEKHSRLEAEKEEASQRERLEQWMANARARLLKADADLTGPSGRVRKEHSPSLHRLAELQKTMIVKPEDTLAQSPNGTLFAEARAPSLPVDPMATISVTAEQFLAMEPPLQPTMREQALARQAAQQIAAQQASLQLAAYRAAKELEAAQTKGEPIIPQLLPEAEALQLTREQALTRKVAQLRKVAEGSETAPPMFDIDTPDRKALQYAIAAVVIIAIAILGLGLFAATQAGVFDGLEKQLPFLRPKMSTQQRLNPTPASPSSHMGPSAGASVSPVSGPPAAGLNRYPAQPVPAAVKRTLPVEPAALSSQAAPASLPIAKTTPAQRRANARAKDGASAGAESQAAAMGEDRGGAPSSAQVRPKAANLGEIILRASVKAATNIDADNLQEMYNRYALGFPGLSGEVVIGITVDPSGRVLEGSIVSSSTGVEAFDQELLRKVLDWRLRAFPDARPKFITVPFLFPLQGR